MGFLVGPLAWSGFCRTGFLGLLAWPWIQRSQGQGPGVLPEVESIIFWKHFFGILWTYSSSASLSLKAVVLIICFLKNQDSSQWNLCCPLFHKVLKLSSWLSVKFCGSHPFLQKYKVFIWALCLGGVNFIGKVQRRSLCLFLQPNCAVYKVFRTKTTCFFSAQQLKIDGANCWACSIILFLCPEMWENDFSSTCGLSSRTKANVLCINNFPKSLQCYYLQEHWWMVGWHCVCFFLLVSQVMYASVRDLICIAIFAISSLNGIVILS